MRKNSTPTVCQRAITACLQTTGKSFNTLLKTTLILFVGLVSFSKVSAQYSGTITIPSGSFTGTGALGVLIDSLNEYGLSGNLTVNVTAAQTVPTGGYILGTGATFLGNPGINATMAGRTLTFNGNGNILTAPVGTLSNTTTVSFTANIDHMWVLRGIDNVTINNFSFVDPVSNTTTAQQMEAAILLCNLNGAAPFDGCQNIKITNCSFNMSNNGGSAAIQAVPHTRGTNTFLNWSADDDRHRDIQVTGNTMIEGFSFLWFRGPSNNVKARNFVINNNTIRNIGGNVTAFPNEAIGIAGRGSVDSIVCQNNLITTDSAHASGTCVGIFFTTLGGANDIISNNTVRMRKGHGTSSNTFVGISLNCSNSSTETRNSNVFVKKNSIRIDSIASNTVVLPTSFNNFTGILVQQAFGFDQTANQHREFRFFIDSNDVDSCIVQGSAQFIGFNWIGNTSAGNIAKGYFTNNIVRNIRRNGNPTFSATTAFNAATIQDSFILENNIVRNLSHEPIATSNNGGSITPLSILAATASPRINAIVRNNTVENVFFGGLAGLSFSPSMQIENRFGGLGSFRVHNNRLRKHYIRTTSTTNPTGGTVSGMSITNNSPDIHVFNNVIDSLEVSNPGVIATTGDVRGISVNNTGTHNIYNNYITDLFAPHTSSTNNLFGINVATTASPTVVNIYHNTIRLGRGGALTGTANTSAFGGAGIFFNSGANATSGAINLKNNIIDINATPGTSANWACIKRSFGTNGTRPLNFLTTSSNNTYRINSGMQNYYYCEGTGTSVTNGFTEWTANATFTNDALFDGPCSAYKGFMQGEAGTLSNTETWVAGPLANTFQPSGGGLSRQSADPISFITTDLNGSSRGALPDRGALQFTGAATDVFGPKITFSDIPNLFCTTGASLTADIVDIPSTGSINTTSGTRPRLYFKKSTETNTFSAANNSSGNGWKWVEATNTTSPFIFNLDYSLLNSAVVTGNIIQYFVIAQDNVGTPNVSVQGATLTGGCPASVNIAGTPAITGAANTKQYSVNTTAPPYSIEHTPATSCQGDTLLLRVIVDSSAASMPTYTGLGAYNLTSTDAWGTIDTFIIGSSSNISLCAPATNGLTPSATAVNGLPASSGTRYSNYTQPALGSFSEVIAGSTINFRTTVATSGTTFTNWGSGIAIYIDYNRNGVLESPAELANYSSTPLNSTATTCNTGGRVASSITVPTNIVSGPALLRVMAFTATGAAAPIITSPTQTTNWGEVEDYRVMLKGQPDPNFSTHKWMTNKTGTTVLGTTNPIRLPSYDTTTLFIDTLNFVGCRLPITKSITVNPAPRRLQTFNATQCGAGIPPTSFRVRDSNGYTFPVIQWFAAAAGGSPLQTGLDTIYLNAVGATSTLWVSIQNPSSGCWSPRAPITLTVTASDSIVGRGNGTRDTLRICQGPAINLTAINVQSGGPTKSFDTFTWSGSIPGVSFPLKNTTGTQTITPSLGGNYPVFIDAIDTGTNCRARDTLFLAVQTNPFAGGQAFIDVAPNPACAGTPITHSLRMANALATMPTYSLGTAPPSNPTLGWIQIDTFQLDNFLSSANCTGITAAQGPAANGLPASTGGTTGGFYQNYTSATATATLPAPAVLKAGANVPYEVKLSTNTTSSTGWGSTVAIFIDFDRNGIINPTTERVVNSPNVATTVNTTCTRVHTVSGTIAVPTNISSGPALCRVMTGLNSPSATSISSPNANPNGMGETEDYIVTLIGAADTNQTKLSWTSSNTGATILGTNHTLVHAVSVNNQIYRVRMVNGSCVDTARDTVSTAVPPLTLNTIVGGTSACTGEQLRLSVTSTGGCVPHTYAWSMFSGTGTITNLGTGNLRDSINFLATGSTGARTVRCIVTDNAGNRDTSDHVISFNNPTPSSVVPDTICGLNSATLCATSSVTTDVLRWFNSATSLRTLAEGSCFTTPALNQETVFFVRQFTSVIDSCNPYTSAGFGNATLNQGVRLTTTKKLIITHADIYPFGPPNSTGTITVSLRNQSGTELPGSPVTVPFSYNTGGTAATTAATATPVTITLGFSIPIPLSDLDMVMTAVTGAQLAHGTAGTFPFPTTSGSMRVTSGRDAFGPVTWQRFNFFNIKTEEGCWGAPRPDTVKYVAPPAITLSRKLDSVCSLGSTIPVTLTAPTPLSTYNSYVWTPNTSISGDSAIGYIFSESTPATHTYVLKGTQTSGLQCATTDTFRLQVKKIPPVIQRIPTTASVDICNGTIQQLEAQGYRLVNHVAGTATSTGSANGATAFNNNWGGQKTQIIIQASELAALPASAKTLKAITLTAGTVPGGASYPGFQIFVGHTTLSTFTGANDINPYTGAGSAMTPLTAGIMKRVYEAPAAGATYFPVTNRRDTFLFGTGPANPLNGPLSDEFEWNKTDNIVILISWANGTTTSPTTPLQFSTVSGFTPVMHRWPTVAGATMNDMATRTDGTWGTGGTNRPNMTLRFEDGAPITWSPTTGLFSNPGATSAYTGTQRDSVWSRHNDTIKYYVTATLPNSCTRRDSITLNIKDTITINQQPPSFHAFCAGDTMKLCINASSTSPITYQWKKNGLNISTALNPSAGTSCLAISNSTQADSGTYEVDLSTGAPCADKTSVATTVKIRLPIVITTQPKDTTVCVGSPMAVIADANNDTARMWTQIGGSNTGNLDVFSKGSSAYTDSGRYFITYYPNTPCPARNSDTVRVRVLPPAMILTDPATTTSLCIGDSTTLKATYQGALGFQWLKNGSPIAGATRDSLVVKANTQADSGTYQLVVMAAVGCTPDTSAITAGIVKVNLPVSIVTQPLTKTFVCQNSPFNASVTANNTTGYQWEKDMTTIFAATNPSFTIPSTQPSDAGVFRVLVKGIAPCPDVYSTNDTLVVTTLAAITTQPTAFQVCEDQSISITGAGSNTASYQWLFNGSPISAPNGTAQTYTKGGSPATMADSGMYRLVALSANAGATTCKADTSIAVLGAVVRKIAITTQPLAKTFVCQNSVFNASIVAQNVTGYQWKKNGTNVSIGTGGTAANYSIASTQPADAGIYTVEMVGISPCPNVTSANDTLQVTTLAAITTQPTAFQVCEDQSISITGAGSNTASYQWLFNGSPIGAPNGTAQTYTKGGSPATMADSGMYRLVALSANAGATTCKADTSNAVLGAVVRKIAITTQPLAKTFVCQNSPFNASITAQNVTSYQWKKNGTNVSIGTGGNTANYSIASTQPADAGIYTVEMVGTSPCPNVTSTNDTLQVTTLAAITTPPASGIVRCETQTFTLTTSATNAASYQWLRNGSPVGTNSTAYSIGSATMTDSAFYRVVALSSNAGATTCKADTSAPVLVEVNRAIVINTHPASFSYGCIGAAFNLNVVAQNATGYAWRKAGSPIGQTTSTMTINPFGFADTGNYDVVITGRPSCPNVTSNNAKVDPTTAAFVTTEPVNTDVCLNGTLNLSVVAQAAQSYQWRKNGVNISGATSSTYSIPNVGYGDAATYDVIAVAYFGCTNDTSVGATVTISTPLAITTPLATNDVKCEGQNISYTTGVSGTGPYTYNWRLNGSTVGTNAATYAKTGVMTADSGRYIVSILGSPACPYVYDTIDLDINRTPVVTVAPNGANPICLNTNSTLNVTTIDHSTVEWHKVGAGNTGQTGSTFNITNATTADAGSYFVIARAQPACSDVTSTQFTLAVNTPASVALQPNGATILEDPAGSHTMRVIAAGTGPFSYQWFRQGNPIVGAIFDSFAITNFVPALDSGTYYCRITAPAPCSNSVNSNTARIQGIKCPAVVTQPTKNVNICAGNAFSLDVTAKGVKTYQWFKGSTAIPGATFANFSIPNADPSHSGVYRCRLFAFNDAVCDITYSDSAVVVVKDKPIITKQPMGVSSCAISTHTMTVEATFGETYQWYRNGIAISPNGDGPSYTYNNVNLIGDEFYVVVGNNLCADAVSNKIVLKNVNPASQVYLTGSTVFNLVERCEDANGWTYYSTSAQSEQLLMAIKKNGNNFIAKPDIELMGNIREISPINNENRGVILGSALFNLDIQGNVENPYEVKFFYSKTDADLLMSRFNQIRLANAGNFTTDRIDLTFILSTQRSFTSQLWNNMTVPINFEHTISHRDKEFGIENNVHFVILKNLVSPKLGGTAFMDYKLKSSSRISSTNADGFGFTMYPVPTTNGKVTVDVSSKKMKPITFTVTDVTGRVVAVFNEKHTSLESSHAFDFSQLANGNYQLMISNDEESAIGKFTISK
ncbi:MAG: T9SS type A sorting domain-containing protein [Chitinophagales bacterium]|nr:T9SS type A sorting domain-containing protein [Chitinophagales bacterium]